MNPHCQVQDQLDTNQPIAPYIIGRELNLIKMSGGDTPGPLLVLGPQNRIPPFQNPGCAPGYDTYELLWLEYQLLHLNNSSTDQTFSGGVLSQVVLNIV